MDGKELKRALNVHQRIARVVADDRFPVTGPNTRMLTITLMLVIGIERLPKEEIWGRVQQLMNLRPYALGNVLGADAPRWEPGDFGESCEAPMIRRPGLCGGHASPHISARVTDPADGTWRIARFCRRHEDHARSADRIDRARVAAGGIPEPVPNTGGLLPCYLTAEWADLYVWARPGWKPPALGLCADDWPALAKVKAMEPPALKVLAGDGEAAGEMPVPSLRLVR